MKEKKKTQKQIEKKRKCRKVVGVGVGRENGDLSWLGPVKDRLYVKKRKRGTKKKKGRKKENKVSKVC